MFLPVIIKEIFVFKDALSDLFIGNFRIESDASDSVGFTTMRDS